MEQENEVFDEENNTEINGVKNDNIDDGTVANQNDVLGDITPVNRDDDELNNMDFNINASNEQLLNNNDTDDDLLTANKLVSKTADNMSEAEERTHEVPLRTENTERAEED